MGPEWWEKEPPAWYDGEPELPESIDPQVPDAPFKGEILDGRGEYELFKDVVITESDAGVRFHVPRRVIRTTDGKGYWGLEVYGSLEYFKERDDYGEIRFLSSGTSFWAPHMYPFEEMDERGLPLIRDRERCNVDIVLRSLAADTGHQSVPEVEAELRTPYVTLRAQDNIEDYNPDGDLSFSDFVDLSRPLPADEVKYPEKRPLYFSEIVADLETNGQAELAESILTLRVPIPERYHAAYDPLDWQTRQPLKMVSSAFGEVWVPLDQLRAGIDATISFPTFRPRKERLAQGYETLADLAVRQFPPRKEALGALQRVTKGVLQHAAENEKGEQTVEFTSDFGAEDVVDARRVRVTRAGDLSDTQNLRRYALYRVESGQIYELWIGCDDASLLELAMNDEELPWPEGENVSYELRAHGDAEVNSWALHGLLKVISNENPS